MESPADLPPDPVELSSTAPHKEEWTRRHSEMVRKTKEDVGGLRRPRKCVGVRERDEL